MSGLTSVARPYAKAAFDFAVEKNAVNDWLEMLVFAGEVAQNETMLEFLSGSSSVQQKQDLFLKVCDQQLNEQGQNLIKVMAENERLLALPQVVKSYTELKAEYEKEVTADVTSAVELTVEQQNNVSAALEKRLARKVKLNCVVDKNVVSGLLIKVGDTVIDGSIRGKLNRLATTIQS